MDANEMHGEKDVGNYTKILLAVLKKILEATPHKTGAVQLLTSHLKNHPSKMNLICGALQEKQKKIISDILLRTPTYGCACVG